MSDAALVVALLPVVLLPQLVGGVHPQVATGAAVVELVALGLLLVERGQKGRPVHASWLGLPLVVGLGATVFQLLPLPRFVRAFLQPVGTENVEFVTQLLPDDVRGLVRPVLSLDPPETAFAAVRLAGAVALFVVVTETCRHRRARALAYRVLLGAGALLFVVALGHAVFRVPEVWGTFGRYQGIFYAPLVNTNHLARAFGGFGFVLVARALSVRSRREAFLFAATGLACSAGVFLTLSRGGAIAFVGAAVVLGFLVVRERAGGTDGGGPAVLGNAAAPLLLAGALALGLWVAYGAIVEEMSTLGGTTIESSKAALYGPALSLLKDYPWVGAGNASFGVAFAIRAAPNLLGGGSTFTHVENVVIEALVDHGAIVGGALLLLGAAVAFRLLTGLRDRALYAPVPALAFLVFGDLFDFALEHAAGLFLAATLLGLAAAPLVERTSTRTAGGARAAAAGAFLLVVVIFAAGPAIGGWRRALDEELAAAPREERVALLHRALALHPFDAQYSYLLSVEARRQRNPVLALKWANRALVLWPALPGAHLEAARALAARGRLEQAMIEYKAAWLGGRGGAGLLREIVKRTPDAALRRSAVPDDVVPLSMLCRALVGEKRLDDAQGCADEVAARADAREEDTRLALEVALLRTDVPGAQARLEKLMAGKVLDGQSAAAAARAAELVGGLGVARDRARGWTEAAADPGPLLEWRLDAALRGQDLDEARVLLARLRAMSRSAAATERLDRLEVDLHRRTGSYGKARVAVLRLLDRKPRDAGLIAELGLLELELDQSVQARVQYERGARIDAQHPAVKRLGERLRHTSLPGPARAPRPE